MSRKFCERAGESYSAFLSLRKLIVRASAVWVKLPDTVVGIRSCAAEAKLQQFGGEHSQWQSKVHDGGGARSAAVAPRGGCHCGSQMQSCRRGPNSSSSQWTTGISLAHLRRNGGPERTLYDVVFCDLEGAATTACQ